MVIRIILMLVLICPLVSAVSITEIMYDPSGSDNNNEYIEVFSDEPINLTGWTIEDSGSSDVLTLLKSSYSPYSLIVEEGFNYTGLNASIYSAGATIGNNLNNDGDSIVLRDKDGVIQHALTYYSGLGDGNSICVSENVLSSCIPTPGEENSPLKRGDFLIKINEFLPDPEGYDNAAVPDGEWIELYNEGNNDLDLTGFALEDAYGHSINIADTNTLEGTIIPAKGFLVVYMNGKSGFLNNEDFEEIKLYKENTLIDRVTYDGSDEGVSWSKVGGVWKQRMPSPGSANKEDIKDSFVRIEKVYLGNDEKAKFGDIIKVKVSAFRSNVSDSVVNLWLEENKKVLSKKIEFKVYSKFINHTLTLPLQIFPNCDKKYEDGWYELILKGFGEKDTEDILVEGFSKEFCKEEKVKEVNEIILKENFDAETNINNEVTSTIVYEAKDVEEQRLAVYFFCFILILLIIYFLYGER